MTSQLYLWQLKMSYSKPNDYFYLLIDIEWLKMNIPSLTLKMHSKMTEKYKNVIPTCLVYWRYIIKYKQYKSFPGLKMPLTFAFCNFGLIKGAFLVFNHLNRLLDLVRLCLDRLFRRLRFRRLNWNSLNRRSRPSCTKSNSLLD